MSLLDRWRINRCVEERRELPAALARRVEASPTLSEYCSNLKRVERSLRDANSRIEAAPPGLTAAVLERLRADVPPAAPALRVPRLASAIAALVPIAAVALVMMMRGGPTPGTGPNKPGPASSTTELIRDLRKDGPAALARTQVEEPLVREARLLARDTRRAADMVLASFPSARPSGR